MWGVPLHYWWWVLALILIAGEVLAPGFFLLWIGIAAGVMGIVTWLLPGAGVLAQAVLEKFGGDSVAETKRNIARYLAAIPENLESTGV